MRVNCRWKDKFVRYSEKVVKSIVPLCEETQSPYVLSKILANTKYWRSSDYPWINKIAEKLNDSQDIHPYDSLELFKYGLYSDQFKYILNLINNFPVFSLQFSNTQIKSLFSLSQKENCKEMLKSMEINLNPRNKKENLFKYLNNPLLDFVEFSQDRKTITFDYDNKTVIFYSILNEEESFSDLMSIIEKHKITEFALPYQSLDLKLSPENLNLFLKTKTADKKKFKYVEVQDIMIENIFGVKNISLPLSLIHRNLNENFYFFYPTIEEISKISEGLLPDLEKNVRISMLSDYCRIFQEIDEFGCFLCNQHKIFPISIQEHAICAAPFTQKLLENMGKKLATIINQVKNKVIILCPDRIFLDLIIHSLKPQDLEKNIEEFSKKITNDSETQMLLNLFFNTNT